MSETRFAAGATEIEPSGARCVMWEGDGHFRTTGPEGTWALGSLLGASLEEGDVVVLSGDLGAGKTNLTKGAAAALGVTEPVTSPTFNIQAVHEGENLTLFHFDLYRLDDPDQLGDAGVLDVVGVEGASLVEWGEDFADALGADRLDISITRDVAGPPGEEPARLFSLSPSGPRGRTLARSLDSSVRALMEFLDV